MATVVATFVDTSALYALLDETDARRPGALRWFRDAASARAHLTTHNYVVIESAALVHRRLGGEAARTLLSKILQPLEIRFVDENLHRIASSAYLAAIRRRPSLVDWVSFEFMRREGITHAFAFDRDFRDQGFTVP